MEDDKVLTFEKVRDTITIDDKYSFQVLLSLGIAETTDYYVGIEFLNVTQESLKLIVLLAQEKRALPIKSDLIKRQKYKISHIVVTGWHSQSYPLSITWDCLSDDPELYKSITGK